MLTSNTLEEIKCKFSRKTRLINTKNFAREVAILSLRPELLSDHVMYTLFEVTVQWLVNALKSATPPNKYNKSKRSTAPVVFNLCNIYFGYLQHTSGELHYKQFWPTFPPVLCICRWVLKIWGIPINSIFTPEWGRRKTQKSISKEGEYESFFR